jgi:hypothetical protein
MKNHMLSLSVIFILGFAACTANAQNKVQSAAQDKNIIQVIDFHSTKRCLTCNAIEKQSRETIEKNFKDELVDGTIIFKTVNIDEEANAQLAEEFEASGTSLFINILVDGQSEKVDLTQFAFMNARREDDKFEKGLVSELEKALKKI